MASAVANAKGVPLPLFLKKLLAEPSGGHGGVGYYGVHPASASGARRASSSKGMPFGLYNDDPTDSSESDDDDLLRARDFPGMILSPAELFESSFGSPTNLSGLLSKLKDARDAAKTSTTARRAGGSLSVTVAAPRGWWVAKHDKDALTLKVPLPGLDKDHVKVWADKNVLMIKAGKEKIKEDGNKGSSPAKEIGNKGGSPNKGSPNKEIGNKGGSPNKEIDNKGGSPNKEIVNKGGSPTKQQDGKEIVVEGDKGPAAEDDDDDIDYGYGTTTGLTRSINLSADAYKMDQIKAEMKNGLLKITVPKVKEEERKDVFHVTVE